MTYYFAFLQVDIIYFKIFFKELVNILKLRKPSYDLYPIESLWFMLQNMWHEKIEEYSYTVLNQI